MYGYGYWGIYVCVVGYIGVGRGSGQIPPDELAAGEVCIYKY